MCVIIIDIHFHFPTLIKIQPYSAMKHRKSCNMTFMFLFCSHILDSDSLATLHNLCNIINAMLSKISKQINGNFCFTKNERIVFFSLLRLIK